MLCYATLESSSPSILPTIVAISLQQTHSSTVFIILHWGHMHTCRKNYLKLSVSFVLPWCIREPIMVRITGILRLSPTWFIAVWSITTWWRAFWWASRVWQVIITTSDIVYFSLTTCICSSMYVIAKPRPQQEVYYKVWFLSVPSSKEAPQVLIFFLVYLWVHGKLKIPSKKKLFLSAVTL